MLDIKNIILRIFNPADLDFVYSIENDEKLWKYGSERKYFSKLELEEYILNSITDIDIDNQLRFIIDLKNNPIGIIDIFNYKKDSADIGIILQENYRNQGYGRQALLLTKEYCLYTLKLKILFCTISKINTKSIKLFQSIGFKEKSKMGNLIYYNLRL